MNHGPGACSSPLPVFPARRAHPLHPPELYSFFREREPVSKVRLWDGREAWLITRWEDVKAVLSSPSVSVVPGKPGFPTFSAARAAQLDVRKSFVNMDPPDHTFYRRLLTKEFTIKRLEALRPAIQTVADELVDGMLATGSQADLRARFAMPLPATVISTLLGVPHSFHDCLRDWTETRNSVTADPAVLKRAASDMLALLTGILEEKMRHPEDDLLSRLAQEQIVPGHLALQDAAHMAALLYAAGHDTSSNQIALGALNLLLEKQHWRAIQNDPALLKPAIEEMLRFNSIVHLNSARVATADIDVGGKTIKAGEGMYALISAANRDPEVFTNPNVFDIARPGNHHLAFSFGVHQCLGQPLARIELEIAFETLIRRMPHLELAAPLEQLQFDEQYHVFHVKQLPVRW